jgi:hypothetical protein
MKILFEVTSKNVGDILLPLANACNRAGVEWVCFFTGDGVSNLASEAILTALDSCASAIACEFSWEDLMEGACPVELGSQTDNSQITGNVDKVISL